MVVRSDQSGGRSMDVTIIMGVVIENGHNNDQISGMSGGRWSLAAGGVANDSQNNGRKLVV